MALIKCPECEKSVSDKAEKCPQCGYPIHAYLSSMQAVPPTENINNPPVYAENYTYMQPVVPKKKSNKKTVISSILIAVVVVVAVVVGIIIAVSSSSKLVVEDITISKWRLTDSTDYSDYYEGTITSEHKQPFIAVIGEYMDEKSIPRLVYVENGEGIFDTIEDPEDDPSTIYRPIGYMGGYSVGLSDLKVNYKDESYDDWTYLESTNCDVSIDIDMNNNKTGLLVFDIINETTKETETDMIAVVINGKSEYSYYAELPYKQRGIDVSIVPKFFCEGRAVNSNSYVVEKAYNAEKSEGKYYNSYNGEVTFAFADYADGIVLYTEVLKAGGDKEYRNVVLNRAVFLRDGECKFTTYDSAEVEEKLLMPEYEFNIISYITWSPLK